MPDGRGADRSRAGFAWRLSSFYAALFLLSGAKVPFLPLWLDWRGLSVAEISIVTAAPLFARIPIAPAIAYAADAFGDRRRALILLAWTALALLIALGWAGSFWTILPLTLLIAIAWTSIMPLAESVAMGGVKAQGLDYGRMRLWGSLSFIAASLAGGVAIERFGLGSAIALMVIGAGATVAAAHLLPSTSQPPDRAHALRRWSTGMPQVRALIASRSFLLFLLVAGSVQAAHAVFYAFGTIHWRVQGFSAGWSGALWAVGVIAEIALFAFSGAAVRAFGAMRLLIAGALAGAVRWTAMAFDPPLAALVGLQALHGLTYGATHLGAMHYIAATVPQHLAGTAQALYGSVASGIALGGATLLAGHLYAQAGGRAYLAMVVLTLGGLAASLILARMH
jgi:PPP family 3-phenylpropionic acid transporter